MEPLLVSTNESKAQDFISELEAKYIPALNEIISEIKSMKLPSPTKDELAEIIQGSFLKLNEKYWKLAQEDINAFKTQAVRESITSAITERFEDFINLTTKMFSANLEYRQLSDSHFLQYFEIDETGNAVVTDQIRDQIYESFKEYITGTKAVRVYKKLTEAATSLQDLWEALTTVNMTGRIANPWLLFSSLFDIQLPEDDNKITITPRKINYNFNKDEL